MDGYGECIEKSIRAVEFAENRLGIGMAYDLLSKCRRKVPTELQFSDKKLTEGSMEIQRNVELKRVPSKIRQKNVN